MRVCRENLRFLAAVSQQRCEIGPRLLLITNRKSYTGSRLAPNSMALDDLERQNRGFVDFLAIMGCETHFKSELRRSRLR